MARQLFVFFSMIVLTIAAANGQDEFTFAVNFAADEPIDNDGSVVEGEAGLLGSSFWDNTTANFGMLDGLTEQNTGDSIPGVSVSWESNSTWSSQGRGAEVGNTAPEGSDRNLMSGYLDTENTTITSVTFDGLPYDDVYDVFVYMKGGVTDVRGGVVTIGDQSVKTLDAGLFVGDYSLSLAEDYVFEDPESVSEGNVLLFSGVSGQSFTLDAQAREIDPGNGTWRVPINAIEISGQLGNASDPFIPMPFTGPSAGAGAFNVREIINNGVIDTLRTASDSLATAVDVTEGSFAILDVTDPDTNPDGGPIITSVPNAFLTNTGGDDDNITSIGKGRIKVGPGQGGDYTFQVNANDGFALRVVGQDFIGTSGGSIDLDDSTSIVRVTPGTSLGVVNLPEGEYDLEFLTFENDGDAFYELTSAQGAITDPALAQWIPVGDTASLPATFRPPLISLANATVFNGPAVSVDEGVAKVRENFEDGQVTESGETDIIAMHDPESGNNLNGTSMPFPINTDADDNNFATVVVGVFTLDDGDEIPNEEIDLTFAIQSDDNGQFHIDGASFTDTFGNALTTIVDINGDGACTGDFNSGNIDAVCTITLTEDSYEFAGYHREGGSGAYYQVWWAEGEQTAFNANVFSILETTAEIPANQGLALVGGTDLICDFDGNGECDVIDIDSLMTDAANGLNSAEFDLTGDGTVDDADRDAWLTAAGPARGKSGAILVGDSDLDGDVDSADLNAVGVSWQDATETRWTRGNFVSNGGVGVDSNDLNGVGVNWQQAVGNAARVVPEPSSVLMLLFGLGALGLARRRR